MGWGSVNVCGELATACGRGVWHRVIKGRNTLHTRGDALLYSIACDLRASRLEHSICSLNFANFFLFLFALNLVSFLEMDFGGPFEV